MTVGEAVGEVAEAGPQEDLKEAHSRAPMSHRNSQAQ